MRIYINNYEDNIGYSGKINQRGYGTDWARTKSQLIREALEAQIAGIKRKRLITLKGTVDLGIDLDALRGRIDVKI